MSYQGIQFLQINLKKLANKNMEIIGKKVKVTKLKNELEGEHPNGVNEGYEKTGIALNELIVGECFYVQKGMRGYFRSSIVTKINDDGTFNTQNSIYKLEMLEEENGTEEI